MKSADVQTRNSVMFVSSTIIVTIFMALSALAQNAQSSSESQGACGPKEVRFDALTTSSSPAALQDGKALVYVSEVFKKVPGEMG